MAPPATPTSYSLASSPFSSPNLGALLKIKVITWSQETGLPVSIRVRVGEKIFNLHRFPLTSKSGYFKKNLSKETSEIELPGDFPGGAESFEMIALFIYGSSSLIDPFNVASLRCAAEFLEMTEEQCSGNLCERFDLYLNQVVLQSWDDTLIVLQRCQILLPWSEDLLIVSRCIESLAFMACMEILDPEGRKDTPVVTMEELASQSWSCEMKDMVPEELWIKDLIALPFDFFKRVIGSLRRQGMKEKYVSPIIVFYANKWLLSRKTPTQFCESELLQGLVDLLPIGDNIRSSSSSNNNKNNSNINKVSGKVNIPVGFYFALLSRYLELGLKNENIKRKLQDQITVLLHFAQGEDFFPLLHVPDHSVSTMENVVSKYVASNSETNHSLVGEARCYRVAELWDSFLFHVVDAHPEMELKRFMELIERVPAAYRHSHDQLYRAINNFLKAHKEISQEEKGAICKNLSCQKLSQETCIEAVQNELMPLRLIVQALFVQQLNTHQTFKECSDSFRYTNCGAEFLSGSLSSSRCPYSRSQNLAESPYTTADGPEMGSSSGPLGLMLHKDMMMMQKIKFSTTEYEATSFRIQNLEQELMSLKRSLQLQNKELSKSQKKMVKPYGLEERSMSKKRNGVGQASSCISSVNFSSQRKYASRILKLFRRLTWFASRKSKRKPATPSHWPNSM
ncbi:BTB/POZ domain-containing protein At5g48130-like [Neltuma alba]|uniref:BTB/POZ domain-containing protein At5g48130-like n=1 Tax=Neltuma alba TaxID=207710 RepID=UPI0010A4D96A|nr:BTB/POZ domain-containing protein At5g48130-like [Prosopis alba]